MTDAVWNWTCTYLMLCTQGGRRLELEPPCPELPSLQHSAPLPPMMSEERLAKLSAAGYKTAAVKRAQIPVSDTLINKFGAEVRNLRRHQLTTRSIGAKLGIAHNTVALIMRALDIR